MKIWLCWTKSRECRWARLWNLHKSGHRYFTGPYEIIRHKHVPEVLISKLIRTSRESWEISKNPKTKMVAIPPILNIFQNFLVLTISRLSEKLISALLCGIQHDWGTLRGPYISCQKSKFGFDHMKDGSIKPRKLAKSRGSHTQTRA